MCAAAEASNARVNELEFELSQCKKNENIQGIIRDYGHVKDYLVAKFGRYENNGELGDLPVDEFRHKFYKLKQMRISVAHPVLSPVEIDQIKKILKNIG